MMASATVDFPQADSPTKPTISPDITVQSKPVTAGTSTAWVIKLIERSVMLRTGSMIRLQKCFCRKITPNLAVTDPQHIMQTQKNLCT